MLLGAGFTTGKYKIPPPYPYHFKKDFGRLSIPDSIFVNAQIPVGSNLSSSGSVSGFTFGLGYKVQRYLEVLVGFSLAQTNDPSVGFRTAAAAIVTANARETLHKFCDHGMMN